MRGLYNFWEERLADCQPNDGPKNRTQWLEGDRMWANSLGESNSRSEGLTRCFRVLYMERLTKTK